MKAAPTVNISGTRNMTASASGKQLPLALELKQNGANLSGSLNSVVGGDKVTGTLSGHFVADYFYGDERELTVPAETLKIKKLFDETTCC